MHQKTASIKYAEVHFSKKWVRLRKMFSGCNLPSAFQTSAGAENAAWLEFHVQTVQIFQCDKHFLFPEILI